MMMILLIKLCGGSTAKEVESTNKPLGKTFMGMDNIFCKLKSGWYVKRFQKASSIYQTILLYFSQLSYHISHRNDI